MEQPKTPKVAGPIVMRVDNWRGTGRRGIVVLNWSEMDHGPVPVDLTVISPPTAAINQSLRDANGALRGALYALDYQRGIDDFNAKKTLPSATTASYSLGRREAAAQQAVQTAEKTARVVSSEAAKAAVREHPSAETPGGHDTTLEQARLACVWQSLSRVQKIALKAMSTGASGLVRSSENHARYHSLVDGAIDIESKTLAVSTVVALIRRDMMLWIGPEDDLRAAAGLTVMGRQVLAAGRTLQLADD